MKNQEYDQELLNIAQYVQNDFTPSVTALETAKYCLIDSLGCAILALTFPACTKLLGPWVSGVSIDQGARVIGTNFELDPIKAAFDIGTMIRWLDYNDTWLAKEWGHPSDNLGGLLSVMDFVSRRAKAYHNKVYTVKDLLHAMVKAHEIQGILAIHNSFNQVGLDHVVLVKVATTAVVTKLLGGKTEQIQDAISQAWIDGQSLRTYRHAPNTGSRKSWAAGDATSRGVRLALMTMQGEKGYKTALSAPEWGFYDVLFKGMPFKIDQEFGSYVMENILFKISFPAEFHAQTAVECAIKLYENIQSIDEIKKLTIYTHEAAMRIINKTGPLNNPADRDHCLQYMVAVALIDGKLSALSYEESHALNPQIDRLREKMSVIEEPQYSKDYLDLTKRSIANRVEIELNDGVILSQSCEYPLGHPRRRAEAIPHLWNKFEKNLKAFYPEKKADDLISLMKEESKLQNMSVSDLISAFCLSPS